MKKAVQQTLIDFTKPTLIKEGILEYNFSNPEPSNSEPEERKDNPHKGARNKNAGSNSAPLGRGGRPKGISKRLQDESKKNPSVLMGTSQNIIIRYSAK